MAQHAPETPARRPQLALAANAIHYLWHGQHIADRFLDGYGWNGRFHHPRMDLVSLYVDQRGARDLTRDIARRHPGVTVYPTLTEALTRGTGKLAVDGVVLVGEGGRYPRNAQGRMEYPRFRYFEETVDVFRRSGRSVPVYSDKHLCWNWDDAVVMYNQHKAMGFPLMAGSSLPVTWRLPSVEMPLGANIREAVCVGYADSPSDEVDSYDFHALETLQCMVERRRGGETGVAWLQAYRGETFWKAMADRVWSPELVHAALCRSLTLNPVRAGFSDLNPTLEQMRAVVTNPLAYHYQHRDGLRCTMIIFDGILRDFNFAADLEGQARPFSTQMYLPMPAPGRTTLASFFSPLVHHMERMFLTGKAPYPVERTLLTTGLLSAAVDSLYRGQQRVETPQLAIRYQPNPQSTFWRS